MLSNCAQCMCRISLRVLCVLRGFLSPHEAYRFEPRFRPSHLQKALVEAGTLDRKTGRGFYSYP
jgi:3-hydroxyacyl-CoA dehydrogenase